MSVLIFDTDRGAESFRTLAVSGEKTFHALWEPVIAELGLKHIGDGRYLCRNDLPAILDEFGRLLEYSRFRPELQDITYHCEIILAQLEQRWNEVPDAERLYMG